MKLQLKNVLLSNAPLKIVSLILGYTFWYIFSNAHITTRWIKIPLCFYSVKKNTHIEAPETITIKVSGKRSVLRSLDLEKLAVHINASKLQEGNNLLAITNEVLFLPDEIKLLNYSPSNLIIELKNDSEEQTT